MLVLGKIFAACLFFHVVMGQSGFTPESHANYYLLPAKDKCGIVKSRRIINGTEAPLKSIPWMALMGREVRGKFTPICGGTLINEYYILSAAHCVNNRLPSDWADIRFHVGESNLNTDPDCVNGECAPPMQESEYEHIDYHQNYNAIYFNDISLVRLKKKVVFNDYVQPACLPFGSGMDMDYTGLDVVMAGWGVTETGRYSPELRYVTQAVADPVDCKNKYLAKYGSTVYPDVSQICVGGVIGKDSCLGDSGGPVMYTGSYDSSIGVRTYVIGVMSYGPPCAKTNVPSINMRTAYYMEWILTNIKP